MYSYRNLIVPAIPLIGEFTMMQVIPPEEITVVTNTSGDTSVSTTSNRTDIQSINVEEAELSALNVTSVSVRGYLTCPQLISSSKVNVSTLTVANTAVCNTISSSTLEVHDSLSAYRMNAETGTINYITCLELYPFFCNASTLQSVTTDALSMNTSYLCVTGNACINTVNASYMMVDNSAITKCTVTNFDCPNNATIATCGMEVASVEIFTLRRL